MCTNRLLALPLCDAIHITWICVLGSHLKRAPLPLDAAATHPLDRSRHTIRAASEYVELIVRRTSVTRPNRFNFECCT